MNRSFTSLVTLQFREVFREPDLIWWAFVIPIGLSWLLGIAIGASGSVPPSVGIVSEPAHEMESWRGWIEKVERGVSEGAFTRSPQSRFAKAPANRAPIEFVPFSREEAIAALKEGRISMFVERSGSGGLIYSFDPRNGEAQMTYLVMERALGGAPGAPDRGEVVELQVQGTRYIDFLVPGLLAMGIMSSALWGIGWALIEIRMKKLMRRMAATPLRKTMFLFSHFVTRLIVNGLEFIALYAFVAWYFGVKIQGNPAALLLVFVTGNMAFAGLAIFTSSRTNNPRVGNGVINALTFPMTLLSGVFFSYHHFPSWSIPLVKALPLTLLADSMRSVFNEGAGLAQVALPSLILAAMGLALFYLGLKIFKWY